MADDQAAFGVYPHLNLKRRSENNNPEASKDMPLQFARGMVKTGLGAIPDLAQLGSDIYGGLSGNPAPKVPFTSEYWENKLPLPPTSPEGRLAGGLGEYFPENPVLGAVGHGIKGAAKIAGEGLSSAAMGEGPDWLKSIVPQPNFVVKPKGGNWLNNNVEKSLGTLKRNLTPTAEDKAWLIKHKTDWESKPPSELRTNVLNSIDRDMAINAKNEAIDNWIEKNLTNYVKKEMGTPEDPVRKLAEEGILHMKPYGTEATSSTMRKRSSLGYPAQGLGKSELAKFWERQSDASIDPYSAGSYKHGAMDESLLENNPWLKNVPDETMINSGKGLARGLGFDHILDVLGEDLTNGRLRPESLKNVSMEQAVRRAYEYDQEMAKKMAEAQIKATEGMPTVKEYPTGHKWIELTAPKGEEALSNLGKQIMEKHRLEGTQPSEGVLEKAIKEGGEEKLRNALKYEGDTMGHCVGGYCPDVLEGRSRIFSLRDAKGEPHVTVEVEPNTKHPIGFSLKGNQTFPNDFEYGKVGKRLPEDQHQAVHNRAKQIFDNLEYETPSSLMDSYQQAADEIVGKAPDNIVQIKGKQNRAPNEQYLPYVQDFVKSGNWAEVGDIHNTGLHDTAMTGAQNIGKASGFDLPRFMPTEDYETVMPLIHKYNNLKQIHGENAPIDEELKPYLPKDTQPPVDLGTVGGAPDGTPTYKKGGKVSITNNPDAMYMEVQDRKFAGGGEVAKMVEQYGPTFMEHVKHYANVISEMMPHLSAHEVMNQATDAAALKAKGMGVPGIDFHDPLAPPSMKMSEALGNAGAEGKTLNFTEADRSRVFGDNMGGVGFSALQHYSLPHAQANTVWGFGNKTVAEKKIKQNDPENTIWTTYAGSPEQHKSNTIVVKDAIKTLQDANNKGQVHPEQIRLINKRIQEATNEKGNPLFPSDFDITDPNALNHANTFERRSAVSDALMGTGVKKPMISVEFKKANPGVQWTDASNIGGILSRETEPVLANANTFDVGPHLFTMDNGIIHRPDLNEAFPYQVTGSDLGLKFDPTPIRAASPEFIEKKGYKPEDTINAWAMSRGSPSQFVSEQYLTNLQKQGYKKGGKVTVHHLDGEEVHIIERKR